MIPENPTEADMPAVVRDCKDGNHWLWAVIFKERHEFCTQARAIFAARHPFAVNWGDPCIITTNAATGTIIARRGGPVFGLVTDTNDP
jgi:hypothetical protein